MPVLASSTDGYSISTTAAKIIKSALRKIKVIDPGEEPSAEEMRDALEGLNDMLDSWNTEKLVVPSLAETSTSISTRAITIGPGAIVDIYRPSKLDEGQVFLRSGEVTYRLNKMTAEEYAARAGYTTAGLPGAFYYDAGNPTGTINLDVVPDVAYTLVTYTWKLLAQIPLNQINSTILLEPGYSRAIKFNLALDLADEWDGKVTPNLLQTAVVAKANVKSLNIEPIDPVGDSALMSPTVGWVDKQAFNGGSI